VVLGPGEKLATVVSSTSAINSDVLMQAGVKCQTRARDG
jgi:hypothetical protein